MTITLDLTPDRCPVHWTPEVNGVRYPELRCTHRADEDHEHAWSRDAQDEWVATAQQIIAEMMTPATLTRHTSRLVIPADHPTSPRTEDTQ